MSEVSQTTLPEPDANGWRPIECAPQNDIVILTDGGWLCQGFYQKPKGWMTGMSSGAMTVTLELSPTHWRPLLQGPVKEIAA